MSLCTYCDKPATKRLDYVERNPAGDIHCSTYLCPTHAERMGATAAAMGVPNAVKDVEDPWGLAP